MRGFSDQQIKNAIICMLFINDSLNKTTDDQTFEDVFGKTIEKEKIWNCATQLYEEGIISSEPKSDYTSYYWISENRKSEAAQIYENSELERSYINSIMGMDIFEKQNTPPISEENINKIINNFENCIVIVNAENLPNYIKHDILSRIEAAKILTGAPNPPRETIKSIIEPLTIIACIATIITSILQILGG